MSKPVHVWLSRDTGSRKYCIDIGPSKPTICRWAERREELEWNQFSQNATVISRLKGSSSYLTYRKLARFVQPGEAQKVLIEPYPKGTFMLSHEKIRRELYPEVISYKNMVELCSLRKNVWVGISGIWCWNSMKNRGIPFNTPFRLVPVGDKLELYWKETSNVGS